MERRSVVPGLTSIPGNGFGCTQYPSETWIPPSNSTNTTSSRYGVKRPQGTIVSKVIMLIQTVSGFSKPLIRNTDGNNGKQLCYLPYLLLSVKYLPKLNKGDLLDYLNPEMYLSLFRRPKQRIRLNASPVILSYHFLIRRKMSSNPFRSIFTIIFIVRATLIVQDISCTSLIGNSVRPIVSGVTIIRPKQSCLTRFVINGWRLSILKPGTPICSWETSNGFKISL